MIRHTNLGETPFARRRALFILIKHSEVTLGGNRPGKIYGYLSCRAGKRMKVENRVFFSDETEAIANGYRPCARCMPGEYKIWKEVNQ